MSRDVIVYVTKKDSGQRLSKQETKQFRQDIHQQEDRLLIVHPRETFQRILGFGGAVTEAAGYTWQRLGEKNKKKILEAYFGKEGICYNFCRTPIQSCDFAMENYSYVKEGDQSLESFTTKRDEEYIIPFLKAALEISPQDLLLFSSPWSPPGWMKESGKMNGGGKLKKECYGLWAEMLARFMADYVGRGLPLWGISVQNESNADQKWESCTFTPKEELIFIRDYLYPAMCKYGLQDKKLLFWDYNRDRALEWAQEMMADEKVRRIVYGIGVHWYSGDHFETLDLINRRYPDLAIHFTEGCASGFVPEAKWEFAERYAHDIIGSLNHHTVSYTDWNLMLDETGGPTHIGNFCNAPVMADTQKDEVTLTPSYYYIGHFSKFIKRGATRVGLSRYTDKVEAAAFKNPDGGMVIAVLNSGEKDISFTLKQDEVIVDLTAGARSMMTILYKC